MTVLWADLWTFVKGVGRHWIAGVTGGILAVALFLAATFHPLPQNIIVAALIGYVIVSAFYAWREEHHMAQKRADARHAAVMECFQRCGDIIAKENRLPFNALVCARAHELETADELMEVCALLIAYEHGDPFAEIEKVVPTDKRLAFVKFVRWSPKYNVSDEIAYLDAAQEWAARFSFLVSASLGDRPERGGRATRPASASEMAARYDYSSKSSANAK